MTDLQQHLPTSLRDSVILRELECGDVDRVVDYFESLSEASRDFFHPHPFDRMNAEQICRDDAPGPYRIVAECDGRIVGYAWFAPPRDCPYPTVGIAISDDFQGKRLGGALMDALTAEARRRGHAGLRLTVYKTNERGVRLYTARGYKIVGEEGHQHIMDLVFER